ncbi:ATP-binding protein [Methanomassiliicoccus luminyensis]|uniref:ATP-binding protein n=1 Tax=Methanomassiliicoccus luminyensis TaxID=1080712 RepID=UPI000379B5C1|nr:ATP-binding protein [Methanomassiliicoccus luminyensis]
MHIGRVVGNSVMETRFRMNFGEPLQVGEMLVVENGTSPDRYLIRVMDIEHGADADEMNWMVTEAGTILRSDAANDEYSLDNIKPQLFCTGVCSPLGCVGETSFKKTKTIPNHFSKVRRTTIDDYQFLKNSLGDVQVGNLRSGDQVLDFPVGITGRAIPHHIGIFATTGMGKSNLMKNLALSCMRLRKYGFLILDPHGEYYDGGEVGKKGLRHAGFPDALVVFSSRKLDGPYNTLHVAASEIQIPDLQNLYEFTEPQKECMQSAQYKYGDSWLIELNDRTVPQISKDLGENKYHEGTINVIKRRLENLFRFDLISRDTKLSVTDHIIDCLKDGKVVLVDTSNMYETEELLISTVLSRAIFEKNKALYGDKEEFDKLPPMLIAMEEAQRVLTEAKGSIFAQIAREGRKFKTGLCAVSQQPKLIDNEIISQFNTLFILGLADRKDREILRNSAKQDISQLDNEIQMLMPGEALIASPFTPFAVPVKIHLYEDYVQSVQRAAKEEPKFRKAPRDSNFF